MPKSLVLFGKRIIDPRSINVLWPHLADSEKEKQIMRDNKERAWKLQGDIIGSMVGE